MIVLPGTTTQGLTDYISVEAGYAADGALLLTVFDQFGGVLGTRANGLDGSGPNGRSLMILALPGIASFSISTPALDEFGVNQIELGDIRGAGAIPEPGTYAMMAAGLAALALVRRRKQS
jgi:hypothetical protein